MSVEAANETAVQRMIAARPFLAGVARAEEVIPDFSGRTLLHAGPPLTWEKASGPMRGAMIGAALYEGWAEDAEEAAELLASGEVRFDCCHHHRAVGPMAGVVGPSFQVWIVHDRVHGGQTFSTLNEASGKVLRFGAYAPEVLQHLRWMNETLAPVLAQAFARAGDLDLHRLIADALHMGDEGHSRNQAGSLMLLRHIAPAIAASDAAAEVKERALEFMGANWLAILNPVMAASKAICDAGAGVEGSTIVTTLSRNGTEFGIRVSGLGDRWFTGPSQVPIGVFDAGWTQEDANPDIGDSVITECAGLGAFAMAAAPAIVRLVGGTPEQAIESTMEMYGITAAEHPDFTIPALGFRGTPTGIDLRKVVATGVPPRVNTGIAHKEAGIGQIGFGLVRPPMEPFREAFAALGLGS